MIRVFEYYHFLWTVHLSAINQSDLTKLGFRFTKAFEKINWHVFKPCVIILTVFVSWSNFAAAVISLLLSGRDGKVCPKTQDHLLLIWNALSQTGKICATYLCWRPNLNYVNIAMKHFKVRYKNRRRCTVN